MLSNVWGERTSPAMIKRRLRALCNGKTSAFQADDAGSIPAARLIYRLEPIFEYSIFDLFNNDIKCRHNNQC